MTDFRIEGVEELRSLGRALDLSQGSIRSKAKDVVRKAALSVERGAKLRSPVDTGNLRSSINTTFSGAGLSGTSPISAEVGPEASYGGWVERGTWRMAPQPYLGPAFDEVEPSFVAALEDLAEQALG